MKTFVRNLTIAAGLLVASSAVMAADIRDGRALVSPVADTRYRIDGVTFGKAELFGYISDLKDTKHITGIVLKDGKKASDEQRHMVGQIAKTLQLEAFVQEGRDLAPIE